MSNPYRTDPNPDAPTSADPQQKDKIKRRESAFLLHEEPRCFSDTHGIIVSTMVDIPGYRVVKVLGTVYGLSVRARNLAAGVWGVTKSIVGGETKEFTRLLYTSRDQAVDRMVGECMSRGGNAIIAMKFDNGELMSFIQVCAYGTACIVEEIK